jgi:hypothetical protein
VPKQARQPVGRVQRRRTCDERMHIAPALPLPRGADWPDYRVYRHVACSVSLHYLRNGSDDTAARATPRCAILAVSPALFSFSVVKDCARNYCSGPYWAGAICRLEATMQVKQTAVSPHDNLSSPLHAYLKRLLLQRAASSPPPPGCSCHMLPTNVLRATPPQQHPRPLANA